MLYDFQLQNVLFHCFRLLDGMFYIFALLLFIQMKLKLF